MAEYIEREALESKATYMYGFGKGKYVSVANIDKITAADVVEVVRCKECTEWDEKEQECSHYYGFHENDFCCFGERRDDNAAD